jgi:hypothetical protein
LPLPVAKDAHRVVIVNVPTDELPGHSHSQETIHHGQDADHFEMFYALTSAAAKHVIPKWTPATRIYLQGHLIPAATCCPG